MTKFNLIDNPIKYLKLAEKYAAERTLYSFFKQAWPSIEGNIKYIDSWHIEMLCEHLEACFNRKIKNLLINIPPGTGKSNLISVAFPLWCWIHNPAERFLCASVDRRLSLEIADKSRLLLKSVWYQNNWGDRFKILRQQDAKGHYKNDKTGYRISTTVRAGVMGSRGSIQICDDPNEADESFIKRETTKMWWDQRWYNRTTGLDSVKIVVQQRTHENDISGHILKNDLNKEWVHLVLPNEFEIASRFKTTIGKKLFWQDKREKEGELLCPAICNGNVEELKHNLGSFGYAGQYQQRPAPLEGGIIKKAWFKKWDRAFLPKMSLKILSCDPAISDSPTASYSACTTWGVFQDEDKVINVILLSMWRGRVGYPDLRKRVKRLAENYNDTHETKRDATYKPVDKVLIEAKATGDPLIRDLRLDNIAAIGYTPRGDKESRVQRISHLIECGLVWIPSKANDKDSFPLWADEFIEEAASFPNKESRDLVDTMSQALQYMIDSRVLYPVKSKDA